MLQIVARYISHLEQSPLLHAVLCFIMHSSNAAGLHDLSGTVSHHWRSAGVGGSGKQSLSRLAAYIRGAYTFQITITKTYNTTNLFEDIKGLYKIAAVKGQPVVFIFTDAEVKDEGFLEYINQILMTGEVRKLRIIGAHQLPSHHKAQDAVPRVELLRKWKKHPFQGCAELSTQCNTQNFNDTLCFLMFRHLPPVPF